MPTNRTVVDRLTPEHLDRVWIDTANDIWRAHPTLTGAWQVEHLEERQATARHAYPLPVHGPYTEVIHG
jgi:hypothetical protein